MSEKNIGSSKKSKEALNSTKNKSKRNDILFLGFAVFVIFIILFWILQTPPQSTEIKTDSTKRGNIEEFKESLINAEGLIIIDKVSGLSGEKAKYVYACGAGLAGSWGKIGKNISNLYTFVINGDECVYSSPSVVNNELSHQSTSTNSEECIRIIKEMQKNPLYVTFEINYGPLYSIYDSRIAYLFVNEDFIEECSFRTKEVTQITTE